MRLLNKILSTVIYKNMIKYLLLSKDETVKHVLTNLG